jgi:hypothetical protein
MKKVTLQILEGVDRGKVFRNLPIPLTIGREEGNQLRLNDERVSRFHAKVQQDNGDVILTDLDSTNGTRVNGHVVQIRRLRLGDCISIGRSLLLYGSNEEISARMGTVINAVQPPGAVSGEGEFAEGPATIHAQTLSPESQNDLEFDLKPQDEVTNAQGDLFVGNRPLPPLPQKMSPAQAARFAEILDFLHRGLNHSTENVRANEDGVEVKLHYGDWQKILAVQMLLARYLRAVAEPDSLEQ